MKVKAIQCNGINDLELVEFDKPVPADDAALLKVIQCGICGTDIHAIDGKRYMNFPFIPGHEVIATVDSVGKNANTSIKIIGGSELNAGDRVTINPRIVCGKCYYCRNLPQYQGLCLNVLTFSSIGSGKYPYLFGGWAEYLYALHGSEVIKLPKGFPDELGSLIEPFAFVAGCIERYKRERDRICGDVFSTDEAVVIYGAGAIGMLMSAGFKLAGARRIVVLDTNQERLDLAREFGATDDINVSSTTDAERDRRIRDITDGLGASVVIEACGVPEIINEGIKLLRRRGRFYELGSVLDGSTSVVDPYYICRNEIKVEGCFAYPSSQYFLLAAKLLQEYKMPYKKLLQFYDIGQYRDVIFNKKINKAVKTVFRI